MNNARQENKGEQIPQWTPSEEEMWEEYLAWCLEQENGAHE